MRAALLLRCGAVTCTSLCTVYAADIGRTNGWLNGVWPLITTMGESRVITLITRSSPKRLRPHLLRSQYRMIVRVYLWHLFHPRDSVYICICLDNYRFIGTCVDAVTCMCVRSMYIHWVHTNVHTITSSIFGLEYSVYKCRFWQETESLFSPPSPLPDNWSQLCKGDPTHTNNNFGKNTSENLIYDFKI